MAFMKFRKGTMPPLRRRRFPAKIKNGMASRVYEFMVEKNSWATLGTGNPIEKSRMIMDPTLNAMARGEPTRNRKIKTPSPTYWMNSIYENRLLFSSLFNLEEVECFFRS
jgi:hypothetical protein